jgi:uncharacterized protein YbaP (TraB family)
MRSPFVAVAGALAAAAFCLAALPAAAQSADARHFLWEVVSMTNRAWLFGTIHAGKKEWFPLAAAVEKAFDDANVVVVEADVTNLEAMSKSVAAMAYAPPDELVKHVPPEDYERFKAQLARLRIPETSIRRLKPFAAGSTLMFAEWERLGYSAQFGIDAYLIAKARAMKKPVVELEGVEAQSALMDGLTGEEHRRAFAGILLALESGLIGEQIDGMVKAWQSGDAFLMLELSRRYNEKVPGAREMEEKFIWSRHEAMLAKVEGWLNKSKDRHFIAVGSLHLAGKRGLVELLREKGYIVRQK